MWICGTKNKKLRLPVSTDKAHGKGRGRGVPFWTDTIHAAIGDGLIILNFAEIRASGLFRNQIAATLIVSEDGKQVANGGTSWHVPCLIQETDSQSQIRKARAPSGSNLMPVIEDLLSSSQNWFQVTHSKDYQYPGLFPEPPKLRIRNDESSVSQAPPRMGHIVNIHSLPHFTGQNHHLLYTENQLSKGHYNDNIRQVNIDGQDRELHIRYAACKGVLKCGVSGCTFVGSKTSKKCPTHPTAKLASSGNCPVYVVYAYPSNPTEDGERWITGITKDSLANKSSTNLHNHPLPTPSKVPEIVSLSVKQAVQNNPGITPSQLNIGEYNYCIIIQLM